MGADQVTFLPSDEAALGADFLRTGHVIQPVDDCAILDRIRDRLAALAAEKLGVDVGADVGVFLDTIHERVSVDDLNDLRLAVFGGINREPWFRPAYYALARSCLATLVGNELAMQRRINLSIQLPDDTSSLLPVHADVWSGDSPYEVVVWLPLVDCHDTKSMYLLTADTELAQTIRLADFDNRSAEDLYQAIEGEVTFLTVPYGSFVLFTQNLPHGNRINREATTRWSMNCRFKGVFAPYADKKLGEFFEPITLRPASRLGLDYALPVGFDE